MFAFGCAAGGLMSRLTMSPSVAPNGRTQVARLLRTPESVDTPKSLPPLDPLENTIDVKRSYWTAPVDRTVGGEQTLFV
jgi:hypothetical protein